MKWLTGGLAFFSVLVLVYLAMLQWNYAPLLLTTCSGLSNGMSTIIATLFLKEETTRDRTYLQYGRWA